MTRAGVALLEAAGCCHRCILIFLGDRTDTLYGDIAQVTQAIRTAVHSSEVQNTTQHSALSENHASSEPVDGFTKDLVNKCVPDEESVDNFTKDLVDKCLPDEDAVVSETTENNAKKQKYTVCVTCIGVLQWGCSKDAIKRLSDAIQDGGHDADGFSLSLSLPVSINLRVPRLWSLLLQACPQFPAKGREDHISTIKDIWKNVVGPQVQAITEKTFIQGICHDFVLNVICSYAKDMEDCKIMDELCGSVFAARQKQHKKYANSVYSKQAIDTVFKKLSDSELLKVCPEPPCIPSQAVTFLSLHCQQAPLYMAGRYNKYSRDLPQTPWFVEGERKLGSSVQELICEILNNTVQAEDVKFSSSGREDVDVRCLGNGRPFVVEFINPQRTKFYQDGLRSLQVAINTFTKLIRVRDLQIVDKKDLKNLKEGEAEKTKAYCALCIAPKGYNCSALEDLSKMSQLVIHQKTPLRVLHRRPLATRLRAIIGMKAHPVDLNHFKLHLTTQAGTYIKEFVHGDLGRTTPNLGEILGYEVDIVALDVENVALEWPPKCSD